MILNNSNYIKLLKFRLVGLSNKVRFRAIFALLFNSIRIKLGFQFKFKMATQTKQSEQKPIYEQLQAKYIFIILNQF